MQTKLQTGLTMIEILVVLAIAGILAAAATPSLTSFVNSMRLTSTSTQLISDLNRARSEAIKRNRRVLVCPRGTDTTCGASWQNGWLVCYDEDQNGLCDTAPANGSNPNPIVVHQALNPVLTLALAAGATPIRFNPSGTQGAGAIATWTLNGTWAGAVGKAVNITAIGHIYKTP